MGRGTFFLAGETSDRVDRWLVGLGDSVKGKVQVDDHCILDSLCYAVRVDCGPAALSHFVCDTCGRANCPACADPVFVDLVRGSVECGLCWDDRAQPETEWSSYAVACQLLNHIDVTESVDEFKERVFKEPAWLAMDMGQAWLEVLDADSDLVAMARDTGPFIPPITGVEEVEWPTLISLIIDRIEVAADHYRISLKVTGADKDACRAFFRQQVAIGLEPLTQTYDCLHVEAGDYTATSVPGGGAE